MTYKVYEFKVGDEEKVAHYTTKIGSHLVNALTGYLLEGTLGSKAENDYFVVQWAIGDQIPYHTPFKLVFNSPHEYEELFEKTLSEATWFRWNEKLDTMSK
jgi:hypothetical protein